MVIKMFNKLRKKFQKESETVYPISIESNLQENNDKIGKKVKKKLGRNVKRVRTDKQINEEILNMLRLSTTLLSTSDISKKVKIRYTSTKNRLEKMKFEYLVENLEIGGWTYWRIKR